MVSDSTLISLRVQVMDVGGMIIASRVASLLQQTAQAT